MSHSNPHSRNPSHESAGSSASGASYQFILEHMLSYPGTYELPLRTMYTLNCAPRAQPTAPVTNLTRSTTSSASNSPSSPAFPYDQQAATAQFTSALMSQISQMPSQPCSLPPAFVTSFLNRCFPVELHLVDFPQSLTALDYLKDLETRRRKEIVHSLERLKVDRGFLSLQDADVSRWSPPIAEWLKDLEGKERKIDALYSQLYVALRRWILVNEMSLNPFSRHNCHAMLNTLYPPVMTSQPTNKLTESTLMSQRDGFFKYIKEVEKRGVSCLDTLMKQGRMEGEQNGWPAVKRTLSKYLTLANSIIKECWDVNNYSLEESVSPPEGQKGQPIPDDLAKRNGRKVDSGVSFGPEGKHSKTASTSSWKSGNSQASRPLTPIGKGGSTLERLARELRKMRPKSKVEISEIIPRRSHEDLQRKEDPPLESATAKSSGMSRLRKMKSLGALSDLKYNNSSSASLKSDRGVEMPRFDPYEMKRQREAFERRTGGV